MIEKLCIFCTHFSWSKEEMWGMGSTLTGPMMDGGHAWCGKGHEGEDWRMPMDEIDFRNIILYAGKCSDYEQVEV